MKVRDFFCVKKKRKLDFSPNLYLGESISAKNLDKIRRKLAFQPILSNVFLLTLSENDSDQIEFFSSKYLVQRYYGEHPLKIVGIAGDREDAISLILKITEDCLNFRKDCSLKEFLGWQ